MIAGGKNPALVQIDLHVEQGSFSLTVRAGFEGPAAVLGPSGAGKTTFLEAVAGLRPSRGRVQVGEAVLQDTDAGVWLPPERRRLGYVPQQGALFPHLSVKDNVLFGVPRGAASQNGRFEELVELLEIDALLERFPRHLSGGEGRRVALARALLSRPRLLLLDEPTAGLDPRRARRALAGVLAVRHELEVPTLVVTHRREEALALAEEVVLLEAGRVVGEGPIRATLRSPERLAAAGGELGRWENVVAARVLGGDEPGGITEVQLLEEPGDRLSPLRVSIPFHPELEPGSRVLLAIDAEELLVATEPPSALSARNAVAGRLDELIPASRSVFARVGPWLAHLTPAAVAELGLEPGRPVWLVAKTHSWRLVAG